MFSTPLVLNSVEALFAQGGTATGSHNRDGDTDTILNFCCRLALVPEAQKRRAVRENAHVRAIVDGARHLAQGTPAATRLRTVFAAQLQGQPELNAAAVNMWPSQRHTNDCADFRDISIVPVAAEVAEGASTFLPLANGSDQWLQGQVCALCHHRELSEPWICMSLPKYYIAK